MSSDLREQLDRASYQLERIRMARAPRDAEFLAFANTLRSLVVSVLGAAEPRHRPSLFKSWEKDHTSIYDRQRWKLVLSCAQTPTSSGQSDKLASRLGLVAGPVGEVYLLEDRRSGERFEMIDLCESAFRVAKTLVKWWTRDELGSTPENPTGGADQKGLSSGSSK